MVNVLAPVLRGSGSIAESSGNITLGVVSDIPAYSLVLLNYVAINGAVIPPTPTISGGGVTFVLENTVTGGGSYQYISQHTYRAVPTASINSGSTITVNPNTYLQVATVALVSVPNAQYESNGANAFIQKTSSGTIRSASLNTLSNTSNAFIVFGGYGTDSGERTFIPDSDPTLSELYDFTRTGASRWSGQSLQYGLGTADSNPTLNISMSGVTNTTAISAFEIKANVPIETIHSVKSSGGDYSSLSAWEAAQQRDLVAANEVAIAECYGFQDTVPVNVDGWNTNKNCSIIIRSAPEARPTIPLSGNQYSLVGTYSLGNLIATPEWNVAIENIHLEIRKDNGTQGKLAIDYGTSDLNLEGGYQIVDGCVFTTDVVPGTAVPVGIDINESDQTYFVKNCIFIGHVRAIDAGASGADYYILNNTFIGCATASAASNTRVRFINNLVDSSNPNALSFVGTAHISSSNNATSLSSIVGTNARNNQTFTFVDSASSDWRLSSLDQGAWGYGTSLGTLPTGSFTTDMLGVTRRGPWDIGALQTNRGQANSTTVGGTLATLVPSGSGTFIIISN